MLAATDKVKFIESVFGSGRMSARAENIAVQCPECKGSDKAKKKLSIRLDDDLNHCWVCGWSSCNLLALLLKHANREDVEVYKRTFLPHANKKKEDGSELAIPLIPRGFKSLYCHFESNDPDIKAVLKYVVNRGISKRDTAYFLLGVSDEYEFKRRVVMPSFDADGRLNFVTTRAINDETRPRYVNSKNSKSEIVFNELKIDWTKELTIVEGPFDLMKCPENSTCLLGSELNESHLLFSRLLQHGTPVVLCLDNDARKKAMKIAQKMMSYDLQVRFCQLPEGSDPGSLTKNQMLDVIGQARPWSREASLMDRIRSI